MATQAWGGGTGAWGTAGNWTSAVPLSNDTVLLPASTTQGVTSGQTTQNAVDPDLIWVQEGANYDIGSSGSELYISADLLKFEGGGKLFFKAGDTGVDLAIIKARAATSGITSVTLNGTGTTDYDAIHIQRGIVALGSTMVGVTGAPIITLTVGGDSSVTVGAGSTYTNYTQYGGTVTNNSTFTNTRIWGGTFNQDTAVTGTLFDVYGGTANILFGGTHPTINVYGGMVDFTRSASLKTITTLNMFGGSYKTNQLVTITTLNDYR